MKGTTKLLVFLVVLCAASITVTTVYADEITDRIENLQEQVTELQDRIDVLREKRDSFAAKIDAKIDVLEQRRDAKSANLNDRIQNLINKIDDKQELMISLGANVTDTVLPDTAPYNIIVSPVAGSGVQGCEVTTQGCESPRNPYMMLGGQITFDNTDNVAHSWVSGSPFDEDAGSVFASGSASPGQAYLWSPSEAGKQSWFCIMHPWITNTVTVLAG